MPRTLRWEPPTTPFTLAHVRALGVTSRVLLRAERAGRVARLAHGVYIDIDALATEPVALHLQRARAQQLLLPRGLASHATAALAWGLALDDPIVQASGPLRFTEPAGMGTRARRGEQLRIDVRPLPPVDRAAHPCGLLVTTRARAAVDVAAECGLPEALITLDSAVRMNLQEASGRAWIRDAAASGRTRAAALGPLLDAAQRAGTRHTRRHLERALHVADGRRESPAESLSFGHMVLAGVPLPEVQVQLSDDQGDMYADFLWRGAGLVGEVDGKVKYRTPDDLVAERRRQFRVEALGLRVVRWEAADIRRRPGTVMRMLASHLGADWR